MHTVAFVPTTRPFFSGLFSWRKGSLRLASFPIVIFIMTIIYFIIFSRRLPMLPIPSAAVPERRRWLAG